MNTRRGRRARDAASSLRRHLASAVVRRRRRVQRGSPQLGPRSGRRSSGCPPTWTGSPWGCCSPCAALADPDVAFLRGLGEEPSGAGPQRLAAAGPSPPCSGFCRPPSSAHRDRLPRPRSGNGRQSTCCSAWSCSSQCSWKILGPSSGRRPLGSRPAQLLGHHGLWNVPVAPAADDHEHGKSSTTGRSVHLPLLALTVAASVAAGALSWFLVERPLLRYGSRAWRGNPAASVIATPRTQSIWNGRRTRSDDHRRR